MAYIATVVLVILGALVWAGKIGSGVLEIAIVSIVSFYFGSYRGLRRRNGKEE